MSAASDKPLAKAHEASRGFAVALQRTVANLFVLEVTTIVQEDIPATRMPHPAAAVRDIARMYEEKLSAMGPGSPSQPLAASTKSGMPAFEQMSERAGRMMSQMRASGDSVAAGTPAAARRKAEARDAAILERIQQNSQELMTLSKKMEGTMRAAESEPPAAMDELGLTPDELLRIHMMWHMGVEHVAMKTIIQVSGDVITRIRPEYLGEEGRGLVEIHQQAIKTSVDFWKSLVDVLASLFGSLGQIISNRKP